MGAVLMVAQARAEDALVQALERIVVAQMVMAGTMLVVVLGLAAAGIVALRRMRRVDLLLDQVEGGADDALRTVARVRERLERAGEGAEARLRRFAAVVDAVQEETEALLLDAASTARGVQVTAAALRTPRRPRDAGPPPALAAEASPQQES